MDEDLFEVEELEHAAEWRLRMGDSDPTDAVSRAASARLGILAADVRRLRGSRLFGEYIAICNWLGESDGIVDFMDMANDYRARIGVDRSPEDGEAYLRALIELAEADLWRGVKTNSAYLRRRLPRRFSPRFDNLLQHRVGRDLAAIALVVAQGPLVAFRIQCRAGVCGNGHQVAQITRVANG